MLVGAGKVRKGEGKESHAKFRLTDGLLGWQINFESASAPDDEDGACVTEIRLDLNSGKATSRRVADVHCEFPTIPDSLVGAHPFQCPCYPDIFVGERGYS